MSDKAEPSAAADLGWLLGLFDQAPFAICLFRGQDHVVERVNPACQRLIGGSPPLVGRPARLAFPELMTSGLLSSLDEVRRSGQTIVRQAVSVRLAPLGPDEAFFTFVHQPLRAKAGEVDGVAVVAFDVTEQVDLRRRAEAEAAALRERVAVEEQVLGLVSHDLRDPLNVVLLGVSSLTTRDLDARASKTLTLVQSAAKRAAWMTLDLLDFTQVRFGEGIRIEARAVDLRQIVENIRAELGTLHPGREIEATYAGDLHGHWDSDRLSQVVQNLLTKALQLGGPEGLIRLSIDGTAPATISLRVTGSLPTSSDRLRALFQPFEHGLDVDTNHRSIGLGLYIVKKLVEAHGGSIAAVSAPESGTTFSLQLPRHAEARKPSPP